MAGYIEWSFSSADSIDETEDQGAAAVDHTPEYRNALYPNGWPPHSLALKIGMPIMLLRNLNPINNLVNGTRLIVTRCSCHVIAARALTAGDVLQDDEVLIIPRIDFIHRETGWQLLRRVLGQCWPLLPMNASYDQPRQLVLLNPSKSSHYWPLWAKHKS